MGQIMKKVLCSLLAVLMIAGAVPVNAIALELEKVGESIPAEEEVAVPEADDEIVFEEIEHEAETLAATTTTPEKVTDDIIEEKIKKLYSLEEKGTFFTVNGKQCAKESNHGTGCSNCRTTELISSGRVKELLGIAPKSGANTTYLPNIRWITPNNNLGMQGIFEFPLNSCLAFASIAHWYLYAQKSTDKVTEIHIADIDYKKENMNAIKNTAKKGDIILFKNQKNPEYQHAGIYIDCTSDGIKVIDCNMNGTSVGNCKIQDTTIYWNSYNYVVISRANTYVEHNYDDHGYCSHCGKYYEEINANKIKSIEGTATYKGNVWVKPHPYRAEEGSNQDILDEGSYKIIGMIENHHHNIWYKISYGSSKTGWIYPEHYSGMTVDIKNTLEFDLHMNTYSIPKGSSVWANDSSEKYNWYGKVSSSNGISKITSVTFEILKSDGTLTASSNRITKKPNATSYTVKTSDDTMKFSELAVGEYILRLSATDEHGKTGSEQISFSITSGSSSNVSVTGVSISKENITLTKGETYSLSATVSPSNATNKNVTWSSSNTSVATVSSTGSVTGVSAGTTVITATTADGNYKASCDVEVIGDTYTITYDLNGGTWSRSNTQIKYEKQETYLAEEIPTKEGFVFGGWESIVECYELSPEKPESGDYTTYYKYYIWGYEHDSDYTFLYGKDKDELIEHIKKNSKTFGSYNPSKMRYFYILETTDKGSSFYPGKNGSNYDYFDAEYISEGDEAGTASIYKTEFYFEQCMYEYLAPCRAVHQPGDMYVVDEDLYLTAIWEYPESFNVYFDPNGGYGGIEYLLVEGTQFTVPDTEDCIPSRQNYLFLYWFDDEGAYEPGNTYTINEDKYLLAAWAPDWEPEITVENITGKPGEVVSVPVNIMNNFYPAYARIEFDVICDGLTFFNFEQVGTPLHGLLGYLHIQIPDDAVAGQTYSVQLDLKEFVIDESYDITAVVKVTNGSITIEEPEETYTITFDPGKGTGGPGNITITGNEFTVPDEIPVCENWNFLFWMAQNGNGYYPGKFYTISENLYMIATFEPAWVPEISIENVKGKPGEKVELKVTITNNKISPDKFSVITGIEPYGDYAKDLVYTPVNGDLPKIGIMGTISFVIPENAEAGTVYEVSLSSNKWTVEGFDMALSEMLEFNNGTITVEEPEEIPEKADATVTIDSVSIIKGNNKTVSVSISENSNAEMIQFAIEYDSSVLKVVSCSAGSIVSDALINSNEPGIIYFIWEALSPINSAGELLNIEFAVADGAKAQETTVEISNEEELLFVDPNYEELNVEIVNGTVKVIDVLYGDVNGDGKINVIDANLVRKAAAKMITIDENQKLAADVNGDGKINVIDANLIRKYAAKVISAFPVAE